MTDETAAPAEGEAVTKTPEQIEADRQAALAAATKAAHEKALADLQPLHDAALAVLDDLRAHLVASLEKAKAEAGHVDYAGSFVRDVVLKADEIVAWIRRSL